MLLARQRINFLQQMLPLDGCILSSLNHNPVPGGSIPGCSYGVPRAPGKDNKSKRKCRNPEPTREPGTDGTFPLFRENVHRESMLFFESQLLTHPRSSRSSIYLTADKPLRSNYLTIGTHML